MLGEQHRYVPRHRGEQACSLRRFMKHAVLQAKGKPNKKQEWESDASDADSAGDSDGAQDLIKVQCVIWG